MRTSSVSSMVLMVALLMLPVALYAQGAGLKPGDSIGTMSLRDGGSDGPPIWAFCSPAFPNPGASTEECTVPPLPELAVGHGCYGIDEAHRDAIWSVQTWELYLDGQQVDLTAFGTEEGDLPLSPGQPGYDPNRDVVAKLRGWDVVLVNPTAGAHTLRRVVNVSQDVDNGFHTMVAGTYDLVINLTVKAASLPVTGGASPVGMPALWLAAGGLLVMGLALSLRRRVRRAQ